MYNGQKKFSGGLTFLHRLTDSDGECYLLDCFFTEDDCNDAKEMNSSVNNNMVSSYPQAWY